MAGTARRVGRDIREAWTDGQRKMRDTEAELRAKQEQLSNRY